MLKKLKELNNKRISWGLLLLSCISFLGAGFYFQYNMGLEPCHLCIIQRIAFLIIAISSIFALINPMKNYLIYISNIIWIAGSSLGLYGGIKLVHMQMNPPEFSFGSSCTLNAEELMNNYPFLDWFPMMFEAKGSCSESSYSFFGILTMEQLTLFIFVVLFSISISSLISLLRK